MDGYQLIVARLSCGGQKQAVFAVDFGQDLLWAFEASSECQLAALLASEPNLPTAIRIGPQTLSTNPLVVYREPVLKN